MIYPDEIKPLWQVMDEAETNLLAREVGGGGSLGDSMFEAVRILALRDWLLPEEEEPKQPTGPNLVPTDSSQFMSDWSQWRQRQMLRDILTNEADRATKSEGGNA